MSSTSRTVASTWTCNARCCDGVLSGRAPRRSPGPSWNACAARRHALRRTSSLSRASPRRIVMLLRMTTVPAARRRTRMLTPPHGSRPTDRGALARALLQTQIGTSCGTLASPQPTRRPRSSSATIQRRTAGAGAPVAARLRPYCVPSVATLELLIQTHLPTPAARARGARGAASAEIWTRITQLRWSTSRSEWQRQRRSWKREICPQDLDFAMPLPEGQGSPGERAAQGMMRGRARRRSSASPRLRLAAVTSCRSN